MGVLAREALNVQNPALGATILWRFVCGYRSVQQKDSPLPLLFIVLPMIFSESILEIISSTQTKSGLRACVDKFSISKEGKSDIVLSIHDKANQMKKLTLESIQIATATKLISIDNSSGCVFPLSETELKSGVPTSIRPLIRAAEKLGVWCGELSIFEISNILRVVF